jgi:hypothetical protein
MRIDAQRAVTLTSILSGLGVYLSDGPDRVYQVGNTALVFEHTALKESGVISRGAAHMLLASGKEIPDPLPLRFAQLVSARHTSTAAANHRAAKCICRYGLVTQGRFGAFKI